MLSRHRCTSIQSTMEIGKSGAEAFRVMVHVKVVASLQTVIS